MKRCAAASLAAFGTSAIVRATVLAGLSTPRTRDTQPQSMLTNAGTTGNTEGTSSGCVPTSSDVQEYEICQWVLWPRRTERKLRHPIPYSHVSALNQTQTGGASAYLLESRGHMKDGPIAHPWCASLHLSLLGTRHSAERAHWCESRQIRERQGQGKSERHKHNQWTSKQKSARTASRAFHRHLSQSQSPSGMPWTVHPAVNE